ncbi:MAG: thiamine-phosphate kinase [Verrucomicrobiales bacterium]|nr:thiamine-phosphate kinase [Verrucomicrobiales bacterium]
MKETDLITKLTTDLPTDSSIDVGPGDDCAVINVDGKNVLLKTDAVVEGVHFTADTPPEKIGRKAIARPLSDIAAMGGRPSHAVVTVGLPEDFDETRLKTIYRGAGEMGEQNGTYIVGGEITRNPVLLISVSLIGHVETDRVLTRKGSRDGDAVFVTGELGGSIAGKHLDFDPRLAEARWLAEQFEIHAMIDLSDGLATDLRYLLGDNLGAELLTPAIPISRAAKERARDNPAGKSALLAALTDGEDYELLFTLPSKQAVSLHDDWKTAFPELPLHCIGKITSQPGLHLRDDKGIQPFHAQGYDHLQ